MSRVRRTHGTVQFPCQKDNANYVGKAETLSTLWTTFGTRSNLLHHFGP
jgi:hypothetical protein